MHDHLTEHQHALTDDDLVACADAIGADSDRVAADLRQGTRADTVRSQFMSSIRSGVNGTPTFFVNGERLDEGFADDEEFELGIRSVASPASANSRS